MVEGGYYIKARSIQNSEIMRSPPHVREVWDWLLLNATHKDSKKLKRGEVLTTYEEIRQGLSWYVGWRKQAYTIHQIKQAMITLKTTRMITTTKSTRSTIVKINNYSLYQNPKNYTNAIEKTRRPLQRTPHVVLHDKQEGRKKNEKIIHTSNDVLKKLFFELVEILGYSDKTKFLSSRSVKLKARLKAFNEDDLKKVAWNIRNDDFMQGDNDREQKYGDIDYLLRNDQNIEKWLEKTSKVKSIKDIDLEDGTWRKVL